MERIKQLRINAGLSRFELAKRARVSASTIYNIEAGRFVTRKTTIAKITQALDLRKDDLNGLPIVAIRGHVPPPEPVWRVVLTCPKCRATFRLIVNEGVADPVDRGVACPMCGFVQILSLRRGA